MPNEPAGLRLLVTRPARPAKALARSLRAAGHRPVLLPLIDIRPRDFSAPGFRPGDILIFVSPNAVHHGLSRLGPLPPGVMLATVGKGTARELETALGRPPDVWPRERSDSEALLAEPALRDVAGRRVFIVRGRGGRETLARGLAARGARVRYLEVYERRPVDVAATLNELLANAALDAILVTSTEILDHLLAQTEPRNRERLFALPLLVIHPRQAEHARQLGFRHILTATNGSDGAIMETLERMEPPA